jgi:hypothetical protein
MPGTRRVSSGGKVKRSALLISAEQIAPDLERISDRDRIAPEMAPTGRWRRQNFSRQAACPAAGVFPAVWREGRPWRSSPRRSASPANTGTVVTVAASAYNAFNLGSGLTSTQ